MADIDLQKTQISLNQLSENLSQVHKALEHMQSLMSMMDTLAAHTLGIRAVVSALAKAYPVDLKDVDAWLDTHLTDGGETTEEIRAVARQLATGDAPGDGEPTSR